MVPEEVSCCKVARWSGLACAGSSSSLAIFSRITVTRTILKNLQERSTYQSQSRILQQIPRRIIRCNRRLLLHCSVRQAISNTLPSAVSINKSREPIVTNNYDWELSYPQ